MVVFQKIHEDAALLLAKQLRAIGICTAYQVCDLVVNDMVEGTDTTIVVTEFLRSLYKKELQYNIHICA